MFNDFAGTGPAGNDGDPEYRAARMALSLWMQYLPNDVVRVGVHGVVPLEAALVERDLPGREPLAFPLAADVRDAIRCAFAELGMSGLFDRSAVCDGFCRAVGDDLIEITVWRAESRRAVTGQGPVVPPTLGIRLCAAAMPLALVASAVVEYLPLLQAA